MNKMLLLQPPQWYPVSPHLAVPLLTAQLKKAGLDIRAIDLNVKFYNHILQNERVREADLAARRILSELAPLYENADLEFIAAKASDEEKTRCLKYLTIKKFYAENEDEISQLCSGTEAAVKTLKTAEEFYVPEKLTRAKHIIRLALRLLSMPFAPNEIDFDNYFANPVLKLDWKSIKAQAGDKSVNMFYDYLDLQSEAITKAGCGVVCISMTDLSQLIPVFTLASRLKAKADIKIILGGNYATQIYEDMMNHTEIFTDFIDYLVIGDGETALPRLCRFLEGDGELSEVPNLVYYSKSKSRVVSSGFSCERIDMDALAYPDFSDYDMTEYFTPQPTYPIQLSKGCYWGKCSFCDYAYGQQGYCPKRIDRIIEEIKHYIDTYSAEKFMFVDEAVPPAFYNRLALAIIDAGLKINFYSFARLEDSYTSEVLNNLYAAGARLFLWGYECESLRIMKMMNKGINAEHRLEILRAARSAGIWNNGLFIFGYPTESPEEISATMQVIRQNRHAIPSCTLSNFTLKKHSLLKDSVGENGIVSYSENGEFYTAFSDVIDGVSQADRRSLRRRFQFDFLEENKHSLWAVVFSDFDHLLLYLSKYGCDYVSSYKSEEQICPEFR